MCFGSRVEGIHQKQVSILWRYYVKQQRCYTDLVLAMNGIALLLLALFVSDYNKRQQYTDLLIKKRINEGYIYFTLSMVLHLFGYNPWWVLASWWLSTIHSAHLLSFSSLLPTHLILDLPIFLFCVDFHRIILFVASILPFEIQCPNHVSARAFRYLTILAPSIRLSIHGSLLPSILLFSSSAGAVYSSQQPFSNNPQSFLFVWGHSSCLTPVCNHRLLLFLITS